MENSIEEIIGNPPLSPTEEDLRKYLTKATNLISQYEKTLVENDLYDVNVQYINAWHDKVINYVRTVTKREDHVMNQEENELFDVVKMASKQVDKADYNSELLDKSGIKLKGLNYSLEEVEKEIESTKINLMKNKYEEMKEERFLYIGLIVLLLSCFIIFVDKYIL
ncbi:hypothetical protein H311_00552 [Anncaliia algerae PRA109]|nr:hypothetical protein H311_00552 [Anncaliia algerae PRA109]